MLGYSNTKKPNKYNSILVPVLFLPRKFVHGPQSWLMSCPYRLGRMINSRLIYRRKTNDRPLTENSPRRGQLHMLLSLSFHEGVRKNTTLVCYFDRRDERGADGNVTINDRGGNDIRTSIKGSRSKPQHPILASYYLCQDITALTTCTPKNRRPRRVRWYDIWCSLATFIILFFEQNDGRNLDKKTGDKPSENK